MRPVNNVEQVSNNVQRRARATPIINSKLAVNNCHLSDQGTFYHMERPFFEYIVDDRLSNYRKDNNNKTDVQSQ